MAETCCGLCGGRPRALLPGGVDGRQGEGSWGEDGTGARLLPGSVEAGHAHLRKTGAPSALPRLQTIIHAS